MKYYECDLCKKQFMTEFEYYVRGLDDMRGGLMIPGYGVRKREFCSNECLIKWIKSVIDLPVNTTKK